MVDNTCVSKISNDLLLDLLLLSFLTFSLTPRRPGGLKTSNPYYSETTNVWRVLGDRLSILDSIRDSSFGTLSRPTLESCLLSDGYQRFFPGVELPGRWQPPSSTKVRNIWSCTSSPHNYSCCGANNRANTGTRTRTFTWTRQTVKVLTLFRIIVYDHQSYPCTYYSWSSNLKQAPFICKKNRPLDRLWQLFDDKL